VLFYAAAVDLRAFRIPNTVVLTIAALFFVHAALSGRWIELHWNLAFAAVATLIMLACYAQGLMGGGDLKLMAVAFLWTGIGCVLPFLVIMVVFALIHALAARKGWLQSQIVGEKMRIPFAPSIAGGLIGIFMLGCLAPP
jgi:prepilin peptidase CpaA